MTAGSIALPRLRTRRRRRRRRPPTFLERMAMFCFMVAIAAGLYCVVVGTLYSSVGWKAFEAILAGIDARSAIAVWPVVHNYLVNGYRDDD